MDLVIIRNPEGDFALLAIEDDETVVAVIYPHIATMDEALRLKSDILEEDQ